MTMKPHLQHLALAAALFTAPMAGVQAGEATRQLKSTTDALLAILNAPALAGEQNREKRREKLRSALRKRFALRQMARLTVANPAWQRANDKQKSEFFRLFEALLERSYLDEIESYRGQSVEFHDEEIRGRTGTVSTRIQRPETEDMNIQYQVLKRTDGWVVYDVVIDGVSAVRNYRAQFADILDGGDFAALLEKLAAKKAPPR